MIRLVLDAMIILVVGVVNMMTVILIPQVCVVFVEEEDMYLKTASG